VTRRILAPIRFEGIIGAPSRRRIYTHSHCASNRRLHRRTSYSWSLVCQLNFGRFLSDATTSIRKIPSTIRHSSGDANYCARSGCDRMSSTRARPSSFRRVRFGSDREGWWIRQFGRTERNSHASAMVEASQNGKRRKIRAGPHCPVHDLRHECPQEFESASRIPGAA
jgi:hypothetical protein